MRRLLLVAVVILFAVAHGMAQQAITITGKVTDEKGASIAGATIAEKGTRNATTSKDDGTFSIRTRPKAKLLISYVGYETAEPEARDQLTVSLNPESKAL